MSINILYWVITIPTWLIAMYWGYFSKTSNHKFFDNYRGFKCSLGVILILLIQVGLYIKFLF